MELLTILINATGNDQHFVLDRHRSDHQALRYAQRFGCTRLVVFND